MQDGLFKDGPKTYRVGRAIFLFAGGTAPTFEEFRDRDDDRPFIDAKGPDFVSRLRGHLNVESIDAPAGQVPDTHLMFRRAMLLRSILSRKRPQFFDGDILRIDDAVTNAFLRSAAFPPWRTVTRGHHRDVEGDPSVRKIQPALS